MARGSKRHPAEAAPSDAEAGPEPAFAPFADDASVLNLGALSIENGTTRIALHGALDLSRDRAGLERARRLEGIFAAIVAALEGEPELPEEVAEAERGRDTVRNPFA